MSNYLTGLAQLNPQVKRHNGGTTTLTLDENGTTNATMLYVNGVAQTPGIDFNVSGTTLTCTSTLPAGTNIATTIQYFNTGIVNTVADDAIGLAQMASGVDGNLITYDASGNPAHVATGNDGQVLTSAGAGAAPAFETLPAAGYEFVSVITASDDATVSFTNMVSGYDYQYRWSNLTPATNDALLLAKLGTSGPTYLTSGYLGSSADINSAALVSAYEGTSYMYISANSNDGTEPDSAAGIWNVFDPAGSGVTKIMGQTIQRNSGHTFYNSIQNCYHDTAASHIAIQFYFNSGNVEAGVFAQYRRKLSA